MSDTGYLRGPLGSDSLFICVPTIYTVIPALPNSGTFPTRTATVITFLLLPRQQLFLAYPIGMLEVPLLPSYWTRASNIGFHSWQGPIERGNLSCSRLQC